jgi:chromosome segregation ATPase
MFDINNIVNAAIAAAVQQATAPLKDVIEQHATTLAAYEISFKETRERIAGLETRAAAAEAQLMAARDRIAALENNPAQGVDTTLAARVAALETHTAVLDQHGGLLEALDNQEWFWHKVAGFITNNSGITANDLEVLKDRVDALESETQGENRYLNRDDVSALIEEAMDEHTSTYDHDEYDSHVNDDDKHFDGDIEDAVRDALSNMTFDVSIR